LGLFENPYVDLKKAIEVSKKEEHKKVALLAAHESIVLLKNDNCFHYQKQNNKKIAVIGPVQKIHSLAAMLANLTKKSVYWME